MPEKTDSTSKDRSQRQEDAFREPSDDLLPSYEDLYSTNAAPSRPRPPLPKPQTTRRLPDNINALRSKNPRLALDPPLPKRTRKGTAEAAARTALVGTCRALESSDPPIVAAHTANAIAVAVSTSRTYMAFVAATTAAESATLLIAEAVRDMMPEARLRQRTRNAIESAVECAMAADAGTAATGGGPSNTHVTHNVNSSQAQPPPRNAVGNLKW